MPNATTPRETVILDRLTRRAQKLMYRSPALSADGGIEVTLLSTAARSVVEQASQLRSNFDPSAWRQELALVMFGEVRGGVDSLRSAMTEVVLRRLRTTHSEYAAPSLHTPISLLTLEGHRRKESAAILVAGTAALIVINHDVRIYRGGPTFRSEGFDSCVQAWIAEAARQGIEAKHVGRPAYAYQDAAARDHAVLMGTVQVADTGQTLVIVATNYMGKYHVVQARGISQTDSAVETRCFDSLAA